MGTSLQSVYNTSDSIPPVESFTAKTDGRSFATVSSGSGCHGIWYDAVLVVPSVLFVIFLAIHGKKNLTKIYSRRSYAVISCYALLWIASFLNVAWCSLQAWQCSPEKEIGWNFLSLLTSGCMLYLEISFVAFLLQESYTSGLESLAQNSVISGILVGADGLLKAIYVFGFGVPLFIDGVGSTQKAKWSLWIIHKLMLTAVYGFILFVHFSKWREKLPPRATFVNYICVMFVITALALFACGLAAVGASFGIWLYGFTDVCYHALYLPFLFTTFLADLFQEDDLLLDNAYLSEMRDAGFFDADWD